MHQINKMRLLAGIVIDPKLEQVDEGTKAERMGNKVAANTITRLIKKTIGKLKALASEVEYKDQADELQSDIETYHDIASLVKSDRSGRVKTLWNELSAQAKKAMRDASHGDQHDMIEEFFGGRLVTESTVTEDDGKYDEDGYDKAGYRKDGRDEDGYHKDDKSDVHVVFSPNNRDQWESIIGVLDDAKIGWDKDMSDHDEPYIECMIPRNQISHIRQLIKKEGGGDFLDIQESTTTDEWNEAEANSKKKRPTDKVEDSTIADKWRKGGPKDDSDKEEEEEVVTEAKRKRAKVAATGTDDSAKQNNNPVAKNAGLFNKASVQRDRKKDDKRGKTKHRTNYRDVKENYQVVDMNKDNDKAAAPDVAVTPNHIKKLIKDRISEMKAKARHMGTQAQKDNKLFYEKIVDVLTELQGFLNENKAYEAQMFASTLASYISHEIPQEVWLWMANPNKKNSLRDYMKKV